jgi:hypothetical protein
LVDDSKDMNAVGNLLYKEARAEWQLPEVKKLLQEVLELGRKNKGEKRKRISWKSKIL